MTEQEAETFLDQAIAANPQEWGQLNKELKKTLGYLMGQLLKTYPMVKPSDAADILKRKLLEA